MKVLYIPDDFKQRPVVTDIDELRDIEKLIGGEAEAASYDHDATTWVRDNGAGRLAYNVGASAFTQQHTEAAARYEKEHERPPQIDLYGPVVITGVDRRDLPERIVEEWPNAVRMDREQLLKQIDQHRGVINLNDHRQDEDQGYGY